MCASKWKRGQHIELDTEDILGTHVPGYRKDSANFAQNMYKNLTSEEEDDNKIYCVDRYRFCYNNNIKSTPQIFVKEYISSEVVIIFCREVRDTSVATTSVEIVNIM